MSRLQRRIFLEYNFYIIIHKHININLSADGHLITFFMRVNYHVRLTVIG